MKIENLDQLFVYELQDLYDAEFRVHQALNRYRAAAYSAELKSAIEQRQNDIATHLNRLEDIFADIGEQPERETCEATVGLLNEADDILNANTPSDVLDAGLIASIQRIEHYKIAGYGTARTYARQLGYPEAQNWLQELLDSAENFDARLTDIAMTRNVDAMS